jgi:hypothetical protein
LLFNPTLLLLPPIGLGVPGVTASPPNKLAPELTLTPNGLGDPMLDLRPFMVSPLVTARWNNGLALPATGEPLVRRSEGLPLAESGEEL